MKNAEARAMGQLITTGAVAMREDYMRAHRDVSVAMKLSTEPEPAMYAFLHGTRLQMALLSGLQRHL